MSDGTNCPMDDCVEPVDVISRVVHPADAAIGFYNTVATLDDVSTSSLLVALHICCTCVVDTVGIAVLRVRVMMGVDGHQWGLGGVFCWGDNGTERDRRGIGDCWSHDSRPDGHHVVRRGRSSARCGDNGDHDEELRTVSITSHTDIRTPEVNEHV